MKHTPTITTIATGLLLTGLTAAPANAATWRPVTKSQTVTRAGNDFTSVSPGDFMFVSGSAVSITDIRLSKKCRNVRLSVSEEAAYYDPPTPDAPIRVTLASQGKRASTDASLVKVGSVKLGTGWGARVRLTVRTLDRTTPTDRFGGDRAPNMVIKTRCK